jgi:hypothetical protein
MYYRGARMFGLPHLFSGWETAGHFGCLTLPDHQNNPLRRALCKDLDIFMFSGSLLLCIRKTNPFPFLKRISK